MRDIDVPVKRGNRLFRLVSKGESAALFGPGGLTERVNVSGGDVFASMTFTDQEGAEMKLTRSGKPCSCKGRPWTQSAQALRALIEQEEEAT